MTTLHSKTFLKPKYLSDILLFNNVHALIPVITTLRLLSFACSATQPMFCTSAWKESLSPEHQRLTLQSFYVTTVLRLTQLKRHCTESSPESALTLQFSNSDVPFFGSPKPSICPPVLMLFLGQLHSQLTAAADIGIRNCRGHINVAHFLLLL